MQAKEFLSQEGIAFEVIDITQLDDPWGTLKKITGGPVATPTVVIGGEFTVGFDPEWIRARV